MNKEELDQVESSQRQHHEEMKHQDVMAGVVEQLEYTLFGMLKPTICRDGNQWCVLYGKDLQEGIAGFGDTPYEAVLDWNSAWRALAKTPPKNT